MTETEQTMEPNQPPTCKLYICGTGVRIPGHLTVETMGVLQTCNTIFTALPHMVCNLLPRDLTHRFETVDDHFPRGQSESGAQLDAVDLILDAAEICSPVAYLTRGNPLVFDPLTQALMSRARARGIAVEVKPAVSSIDTILVDLNLELQSGLQIFDSTAFVRNEIPPRADVACLLIDPCSAKTLVNSAGSGAARVSLETLRDHLLRFYPPNHVVVFVATATAIGARATLARFQLGEIGDVVDVDAVQNASLYVPALGRLRSERMATDYLFENDVLGRASRKNDFQA